MLQVTRIQSTTARILEITLLLSALHGSHAKSAQTAAKNVSTTPTSAAGSHFRECPGCPEMVVIPAGTFTKPMVVGFDMDPKDAADRPPVPFKEEAKEISSQNPIAMGAYPVTRAQYQAFVEDTGRLSPNGCRVWDKGGVQWNFDPNASWEHPGFSQTPNDPVVCVSWEDIQAYIHWVNAKARGQSRLHDLGDGPYRLPTLDEALYAQAAGAKTAYAWGNDADPNMGNFGAKGCFPCRGFAGGHDRWIETSPVGSFPANAFGLYDMVGNVSEISETRMSFDAQGPDGGKLRQTFGASWLSDPEPSGKLGQTSALASVDRTTSTGFRLVRTLVMPPSDLAAEPPASQPMPPKNANADLVPIKDQKLGGHFQECPQCPQMAIVPPGRFYMREPSSFPVMKFDWPGAVMVTIPRPFAAAIHDVTKREYAVFVRETHRPKGNGCAIIPEGGGGWTNKEEATWDHPGFPQTDNDPVVCVSWNDTQDYIRWLNAKILPPGADPAKGPYRLPSNEEWSYAERAGMFSSYYPYEWGEIPTHERGNYGFGETQCGACGARKEGRDQWLYTSPVGSFPPNSFGLYDMGGNVWNYTDDCAPLTPSTKDFPRNGSAWTKDLDCHFRIARGDSFDDNSLGDDYLNPFGLNARNMTNGFRLVRDLN